MTGTLGVGKKNQELGGGMKNFLVLRLKELISYLGPNDDRHLLGWRFLQTAMQDQKAAGVGGWRLSSALSVLSVLSIWVKPL